MSINTTEQIRRQKLFEQGYRNDEIILLDKREGEGEKKILRVNTQDWILISV